MRTVWRVIADHRDFRLVLGAGLVSMTGDWILEIGLAYYIYAITGSTLASATMLLASFIPQILFSSVAGVFVDRWDRKRTMIGANLLLSVGLAPLVLVHSADRVWIIYVVLMWEGIVQVFFSPAEQALVPHLVPDDRLVTANALNGQNADLSRLVGSAVGGVVAGLEASLRWRWSTQRPSSSPRRWSRQCVPPGGPLPRRTRMPRRRHASWKGG